MRRRKSVRVSHPEPIAGLVEETFRWLKLDEAARSFRALRAFSQAAGPRIRAVARAEKLRGATLYVRVSSAAWSHELHALKAELIAKLKRTPGGESVEDVRFSVGPLDEAPEWGADLPAPTDPRSANAREPAPILVTDEIRRAVEAVRDPELQAELSALLLRPHS